MSGQSGSVTQNGGANGASSSRDPIAIVGIGCRLPGASGADAFWRFLCEEGDAIREVPDDRFEIDDFFDPRPGTPGKISSRWGGFIDDIDRFDAGFFGISPREASRMDPQQRILLEISIEALEDAGIAVDSLDGSSTAVFVGLLSSDYGSRAAGYAPGLNVYSAAGGELSVTAGRISFALGVQGPAFSVNAACASSIVSVHLACQSLWAGESTLALAAGSNLILRPEPSMPFAMANMLAADGHCKFCSAEADGFVRSEGAGVVVLKPLSKALENHDPIYAVIRGTACNNDGDSGGLLMTPSRIGQAAALREAYRDAGVSPGSVHYVEAHGTGTRAGDPVELGALSEVMGTDRPTDQPLRVGSVKSNIGHLEGGAGIAGLIKAALCLKHRAIPRTLHCDELNPEIPWDEIPLQPQREFTPWPYEGTARVGVSSNGINGTNGHLVLEEAPQREEPAAPQTDGGGTQILTLSAQTSGALRDLANATRSRLVPEDGTAPPPLADLCYSAGARRGTYDHSVNVLGSSHQAIADELGSWLDGEVGPRTTTGRRLSTKHLKTMFVFPGQGSQWLGMGRQLIAEEPVFRGVVEACHEAMKPFASWSLLDELHASESASRLDQLDFIQPAIFSMQVALAAQLRAWGVEPDVLVGQSLGEIAAAYTAKALSLDDAARVICERSRLVHATCGQGQGGMAYVGLPLDEARAAIESYGDALSIAVSSGPVSTIVSGNPDALNGLLAELEGKDVFGSLINVDYASHSAHMDTVRDDLVEALAGLQPRAPKIPIVSTVTGQLLGDRLMDAEYWWQNLREPVLFNPVLQDLLASDHRIIVEASPHAVVTSGIQQGLRHLEQEALVVPAMRRDEDQREVLLSAVGAIRAAGGRVDWEKLCGSDRRFVALPTYPWQRERYWFPDDETLARQASGAATTQGHPLLGRRFSSASHADTHFWEMELGTELFYYLSDHRFQDVAVFPGTGYLEMALAAAAELYGPGPHLLEDVHFETALYLPEHGSVRVQLCVTPGMTGTAHFQLFSVDEAGGDSGWKLHASGAIRIDQGGGADDEPTTFDDLRASAQMEIEKDQYYEELLVRGLAYGPTFQGVERIWRGAGEAVGRVRVPETLTSQSRRYRFHPAFLDACLQVCGESMPRNDPRIAPTDGYMPIEIERVRLHREPPDEVLVRSWSEIDEDDTLDTFTGGLEVRDVDGHLVLEVEGFRGQRVDGTSTGAAVDTLDDWLYEMSWSRRALGTDEIEAAPAESEDERWVILTDEGDTGNAIEAFLEELGQNVTTISRGSDYERVGDDHYRVDPLEPGDFQKVFKDVFGRAGAVCRGVLHLWNLDTPGDEIDINVLAESRTTGCISVLHTVQAAIEVEWARHARLWLLTRGAHAVGDNVETVELAQSPVWGLGRVVSQELPELGCVRVDLDPRADDLDALRRELFGKDREDEIAFRGGERYVYRLGRHAIQPESGALANVRRSVPVDMPFRLELGSVGLLDTMRYRAFERRAPEPGEVEIRIEAASLQFRDLLLAMGVLPEEVRLGWECAGRISAVGPDVGDFAVGDEVLAFVPGCFGSYTYADAIRVVPKPAALSFEQGAAIPLVFLTAVHCLETLARIQPGESILIHSAAGGVGLAAIQIAKRIGAEIYATAGNEEKRQFLHDLGVRHVMDSRSFEWVREIKEVTDGEGVDVVLNFLEGEAIQKGLSVLKPFGRFVEIGKKDLIENSRVGLEPFLNNLQFLVMEGVQLGELMPEMFGEKLRELLPQFEDGTLQPLPVTIFPFSQAPDAFRLMAQAKHIGKIVLSFGDETHIPVTPPAAEPAEIRPDGTYLITGGLGGLGLEVAQWAVAQGARHLVLLGRSGPKPEARQVVATLEKEGAEVRILSADVSDSDQVRDVFAEIRASMPPLRGILHAAVVLDDGILAQLEHESFDKVMAPKVEGSWHLHLHSQEDPLDFFVLFSSAASLLGSPGQGNYSAANAFQDSLAFYRRIAGLPAQTINWGAWTVGQAVAASNRAERIEKYGVSSMTPEQGTEILRRLLRDDTPQVMAIAFKVEQWCQHFPEAANSPLLDDVRESSAGGGGGGGGQIRAKIASTPADERIALIQQYLGETLMRVLQLEGSKIDPDQSLNRMGLDSLMAMELRNRVQTDLQTTVPIVKLLKGVTIAQLSRLLLELVEEDLEDTADSGEVDPLIAEIESLSDEEAARLLAEDGDDTSEPNG
jgi:acyl transferase domain-containing protein/aryl carrier-like protein